MGNAQDAENVEWGSLADIYAEAPHQAPEQLDFVSLHRLANAKRAE